jgi:hypothetical protein
MAANLGNGHSMNKRAEVINYHVTKGKWGCKNFSPHKLVAAWCDCAVAPVLPTAQNYTNRKQELLMIHLRAQFSPEYRSPRRSRNFEVPMLAILMHFAV